MRQVNFLFLSGRESDLTTIDTWFIWPKPAIPNPGTCQEVVWEESGACSSRYT